MECGETGIFKPYHFIAASQEGNFTRSGTNGFLLAYCFYGQLSNQIICLRIAFVISGLLGRTLLFNDNPEELHSNVNIRPSIDVERVNSCFGKDSMISTSEYVRKYGKPVQVDEAICWLPKNHKPESEICPSPISETGPYEHMKSILYDKKVSYKTLQNESYRLTANHLRQLFWNAKGKILTIGELFHPRIKEHLRHNAYRVPFRKSPSCKYLLDFVPEKKILEAAFSFVNETFGGSSFMAVHWRRGDFSYFQKHGKTQKYRPLRAVAYCIAEKAVRHNVSHVFIATNEKAKTMNDLRTVVSITEPTVTVLFLEKAAENLVAKFLGKAELMSSEFNVAPFEKVVCALSEVFLGTPSSTFSQDIERLRYGFKTANCRDSHICEGLEF